MGAGVDGIVMEAAAADSLVVTVRAVCTGQLVVPGELWQRLSKPALSMREKQALAMVVMGFSNAEIARKLFVTEATVKSHLSSAFSKLACARAPRRPLASWTRSTGSAPGSSRSRTMAEPAADAARRASQSR